MENEKTESGKESTGACSPTTLLELNLKEEGMTISELAPGTIVFTSGANGREYAEVVDVHDGKWAGLRYLYLDGEGYMLSVGYRAEQMATAIEVTDFHKNLLGSLD